MKINRLCAKFPHETNESARGELARILLKGGRLETLTLYQCSICDGAWHVGNKNSLSLRSTLTPPYSPRWKVTADDLT